MNNQINLNTRQEKNLGAIPAERDAAPTNMFEGKIAYRILQLV